jgi:hypothetical protein
VTAWLLADVKSADSKRKAREEERLAREKEDRLMRELAQ